MTPDTIQKVLIGLFAALFGYGIFHVIYLAKQDTYATEKYMRVTSILTYSLAAMLYVIFLYNYYHPSESDIQTYVLHVLLGILMLVYLPATLVTMSSYVITAGNV